MWSVKGEGKMKNLTIGVATILALLIAGSVWGGETQKGVCRHEALLAATLAHDDGFPVRIWTGPRLDGNHAQAQLFIDGSWEWIHISGDTYVTMNDMDSFFKPDRSFSVPQFVVVVWGEPKKVKLKYKIHPARFNSGTTDIMPVRYKCDTE